MKRLIVSFVILCGCLSVNARYYGDINNDASLNIADVSELIDIILNSNSGFDKTAADVNQDGTINGSDVTELVNIVVGTEQPTEMEESTEIDYDNWMSKLDDSWSLTRLSIPGTHDACTEGAPAVGRTQSKTIEEQLACGVRMFDLRPRVHNGEMSMYHGYIELKIKFNDVLSTLCSFLDGHPNEFLFVIMRHEDDSAGSSDVAAWPAKMYECLNEKKDYIIDYNPSLTVKDMRGKLLVMSRDHYDNGPIGAYLDGGSDNSVYDRTMYGSNGEIMNTTFQDMYKVTKSGELDNKVTEIKNLLDRSISENETRLYFNHTSGYSKTVLGIPTSAGIKECSETCNSAVIDYMDGKVGPMGFILMDFAGDEECHGQTLIDTIIHNNQNLMKKDREKTGIRYNKTSAGDGRTYNLQGVEVGVPSRSGIYIKNGKTILIK